MTIEKSSIPENLLSLATMERRVVPNPKAWNQLWKTLRSRTQKPSGAWEPSLPLILDAWWDSNDVQKRERFLEHLEWAVSQGQTEQMIQILRELKAEDWYSGEG